MNGPMRDPDEVLELWDAEIEGESRAKQGGNAGFSCLTALRNLSS